MRIDDGFSTLISFSLNAAVKLWEKEVTPPGIDGGGPIDTTTMRNTAWRTSAPKQLKTLTPVNVTAAYDPRVMVQAKAMINQNQLITVTYADGSTYTFWGYLDKFEPGAATEGEQPTADCTIQPTLVNHDGDEVEPVFIDNEGDTNDTNSGA